MVSVVDASDRRDEDSVKHIIDGHPAKDIKLKDGPLKLEDGWQAAIDELVEINIGSEDDPKSIFLSAQLSPEGKKSIRNILVDYIDCFAWSYKEIPVWIQQ